MTEHVVLRRVADRLVDLDKRVELARMALDAAIVERDRVGGFVGMYREFAGDLLSPSQELLLGVLEQFVAAKSGRADVESLNFERVTNPESLPEPLPAQAASGRHAGDEDGQHIPEAPTPLPEGEAPATSHLATPAEAKTSDQEPLSSGSGEVSRHGPGLPAYAPETATLTHARQRIVDVLARRPNLPETANQSAAARKDEPHEAEADLGAGTQAPPADTPPEPGKPVEPSGSAAPLSKKQRVGLTHEAHPDWTIAQIAGHLGLTTGAVGGHLSTLGVKLGHKGTPRAREAGSPTLRDRVLECHKQHPDWPQKQIADALGVGTGSVSNAAKGTGIEFPRSPNSTQKPDSQRARVEAYLADHPGATAKEISEALGLADNSVRALAAANGFKLGKLSPEENTAAKRAGGLRSMALRKNDPLDNGEESRRRKYGEPDAGEPSEQLPDVTHLVRKDVAPETLTDQDDEPISPAVVKFGPPKAKYFRLRRADGAWLYMSGSGFTHTKNDGWIGKIGQLRTARERFPDARGLQIVGVQAK